jgi:N-acetylmuramoyl-L-alanine amidase
MRRGHLGQDVRDVQHRLLELGLRVGPDELEGLFGPSTESAVRAFQQQRGLPADGQVGPDTWSELVEAGRRLGDRTLYLRSPWFRGDDVRELQRRLNALGFEAGKEDGIFGPGTHVAVQEFQRNTGADVDGIVGPGTIEALDRLRPAANGVSRAVVRETEDVLRPPGSIQGSRIAIDPGHGAEDPGNVGPNGLTEADAVFMLAADLADELRTLGALPSILRTGDENPPPSDRARAANALDATLCISLHCNGGEPEAAGACCFFYGTEGTWSPAGERLAEVIVAALTSRLELTDGRTHRMTIPILRETRMPAVHVEACFITNPDEEKLLADPTSRKAVAAAIAVGIQRFFTGAPELPEQPATR